MNDTGIIIQARSKSSRFPNKVLMPFWEEKSLLDIAIEVCKENNTYSAPIVVATSDASEDDEIAKVANRKGVNCFRGSENDVLSRFVDCAERFHFYEVVRVCADNPFLSGFYLSELLRHELNSFDYLSYISSHGLPAIKTHLGLFCEKVKLSALKKIQQLTDEMVYREHVTNFLYLNDNLFNISFLQMPNEISKRTDIRLTCDTQEDFYMLKILYQEFKNVCDTNEYLRCLIRLIDANSYYTNTMIKGINMFTK